MRNDLKLSIELNKVLEPVIKENYSRIRIKEKPDYLLYFEDAVTETGFYFGILREKTEELPAEYGFIKLVPYVDYCVKPSSTTSVAGSQRDNDFTDFIVALKTWLSNIQYYHKESILNDPILNGYQKEFYNDFKILDDDADQSPFGYTQQLQLDQFMDNVINNIDSIKNDRNKEIIDEIKADTLNLQNELTVETKNGFMSKLSAIFAKARKGGFKIAKFMLEEFAKEFLKDGAKAAFDFAVNHSGEISKYVKTAITLII